MHRLLTLLLLSALTATTSAQFTAPQDVPAYHPNPPAKGEKLAPILPASKRVGENFTHPAQLRAYQDAEKVPAVLHQIPCYCYCDRSAGHKSLHSCFESEHGAHCAVCMKEAIFAYEQTRKGKTPKQIREAVMRGEWQSVTLE